MMAPIFPDWRLRRSGIIRYSKIDSDRQPESSTERETLALLEPAAHGAFYYNVKIGKEDYYFENVNGVRSLETRNNSKYVASEDALCELF